MKGSKCQVLLSKYRTNGDIEFSPVYFSSATKIAINSDKRGLDRFFQ